MDSAREALVTGLRALAPSDKFNVIAFDNLQEYLSEKGLVQATPEVGLSKYTPGCPRLTALNFSARS